jgi:hypothetical protein
MLPGTPPGMPAAQSGRRSGPGRPKEGCRWRSGDAGRKCAGTVIVYAIGTNKYRHDDIEYARRPGGIYIWRQDVLVFSRKH